MPWSRWGGDVIATMKSGAKFQLDVRDWPQAQAYMRRRYDATTLDFIAAHLPRGGVFFDVGAHVGLIALQVLMEVPGSTGHAFEPHPQAAARLRRNAKLNGFEDRLVVNQTALSAASGTLQLDLRAHKVSEEGREPVRATTLDDYLDRQGIGRVDVMKVDVEGHERAVFAGAISALQAGRIRAVTFEAMEGHGDVDGPVQVLESAGYRPVKLPGRGRENMAYIAC